MGFDEYARSLSFEKDPLKLKFIMSSDLEYPDFDEDEQGFIVRLPLPRIGEGTLAFLGYTFPDDVDGRKKIVRLFRASVYHLSGHALSWKDFAYDGWREGKNDVLSNFVVSLVEDIWVNQCVATWYPDKLLDLGFAGAMMLARLRAIDNIRVQATRLMVSLMVYANTGLTGYVSDSDLGIVEPLYKLLKRFKEAVGRSLRDEGMDLLPQKLEAAESAYRALSEYGPIIEAPSPPFSENLGASSLFPPMKVGTQEWFEGLLAECVEGLSGGQSIVGQSQPDRVSEAETLQVFESHFLEKAKEAKILSRYEGPAQSTRFNSLGFPNKDYSEYLRAKARCKRSTSKMTEVLMGAMNEFMEDIRKKFGVLDLADAVQVVASKSERTDIFLKDEKIKQSFAWAIVVDASTSMRNVRDYALETAIILAESAGKVLLDMTSWSIFAFNDGFEIVKDFSEQYNSRVKARLGGLSFRGLSYMPDAIELAGRALAARREELKVMMVLSDGWPYGYTDIDSAASEVINNFVKAGMAVIGVGVQSGRMEYLFDSHCTSYTLKQFVDRFSTRFYEACDNAV
ncbi:MAG: VWA domain-containing protein [Candidatus Bathyarchaeota archaeon]|nr:VWA domain-containing protein [Candidatus Bathyarchaeota archaeon]